MYYNSLLLTTSSIQKVLFQDFLKFLENPIIRKSCFLSYKINSYLCSIYKFHTMAILCQPHTRTWLFYATFAFMIEVIKLSRRPSLSVHVGHIKP